MLVGHYKTLRGKHKQTLFDINHSKIFFEPPPKVLAKLKQNNKNKTKN